MRHSAASGAGPDAVSFGQRRTQQSAEPASLDTMAKEESTSRDLVATGANWAVPGAGPVIARLWNSMVAEWDTNRSVALRIAETVSGLRREDLAERIERRPELVPALTRLMWEAAMTGRTELLETMGAAFGAAVGDLERLPDYEMVLSGLSQLVGSDIQILKEIRAREVFHHQATDEPEFTETEDFATVLGISKRLDLSESIVAFGLRRLENQGFVMSVNALSGTRFAVTDLGLLLFDALERVTDVAP